MSCVSIYNENLLYMQGLKSDGEVDHDRVGEVYTTLVALLKAKSKVFATNIGKQVVCVCECVRVCVRARVHAYLCTCIRAYNYNSVYMYM